MATHSSIVAWRIPWTEEPGGPQSIASQSRTQLKQLSTHACTVNSGIPSDLHFVPRDRQESNSPERRLDVQNWRAALKWPTTPAPILQ